MFMKFFQVVAVLLFSGLTYGTSFFVAVAEAQTYSSQYITPVYQGRNRGFDHGTWTNIGCKRADFIDDRYVMRVDRAKGPFDKLRLKISSDDFHIIGLKVVYGNGERARLAVRSEDSYPGRGVIVRLSGRPRYIRKIIMKYGSRVSSYRPIVVCVDAHEVDDRRGGYGDTSSDDNYDEGYGRGRGRDDYTPPRPAPVANTWQQLGCVSVRHKTGHKVVTIGRGRGRFKAIRLRIKNQPAKIKAFTVIFGNGKSRNFKLYGNFRPNSYSPIYRFGNGRHINSAKISLKSKLFLVKTKVCLEGLPAARASVDDNYSDDYAASRWKTLGCVAFHTRNIRSQFLTVGRRKGRLKEVRLQISGRPFVLKDLGVVFNNGRDEVLSRSKSRIGAGSISRVYRFRQRHYVKEIEIVGLMPRFAGRSRVCVQGR